MEPEKSGGKSGPPGGFQPGPDPRRGRGPKKGAPNAGRPRNEQVEFCRKLLKEPKVRRAVRKILTDADHPQFATLYGKVDSRGHGSPTVTEVQVPLDYRLLTDEQLERIAAGESPLLVLATARAGGAGAPEAGTEPHSP